MDMWRQTFDRHQIGQRRSRSNWFYFYEWTYDLSNRLALDRALWNRDFKVELNLFQSYLETVWAMFGNRFSHKKESCYVFFYSVIQLLNELGTLSSHTKCLWFFSAVIVYMWLFVRGANGVVDLLSENPWRCFWNLLMLTSWKVIADVHSRIMIVSRTLSWVHSDNIWHLNTSTLKVTWLTMLKYCNKSVTCRGQMSHSCQFNCFRVCCTLQKKYNPQRKFRKPPKLRKADEETQVQTTLLEYGR